MTLAWYIDTLDAAAGRAFATWRTDDLAQAAALDESGPTFFIGPPDFEPEPVASRALALAAGRYGFQEGLSDETGEIPFDELAAVSEFVRRAYLRRGGGTDGGGGGGEAAPPGERGPPPPDFPPLGLDEDAHSEWGEDPARRFAAFAGSFADLSASVARGRHLYVFGKYPEAARRSAKMAVARLARGSARVAIATADPPPDRAGTEEEAASAAAQSRLIAAIRYAGLSEEVRRNCQNSQLEQWIEGELKRRARGTPSIELLALLIGYGDRVLRLRDLDSLISYGWRRHSLLGDPLDLLFQLPAPRDVQARFATAARRADQVTIGHVLFAVLASPQTALPGTTVDAGLFEILLFAAALMVAPAVELQLAPWGSARNYAEGRAASLALKAETWLRRNIATKAFSQEVESLIQGVPSRAATTA